MKKIIVITVFNLFVFGGFGQTVELVKNINETSELVVTNHYSLSINGTLYFNKDDGINGYALWKTDGTNTGTIMVKDLSNSIFSQGPKQLINHNGVLYFISEFTSSNGEKFGIFKTDGTEQGTLLVKEISQFFGEMVSAGNSIYFVTKDDGSRTKKLWKTDGTEAGTILVKEFGLERIYGEASVFSLTNFNNNLLFAAQDNNNNIDIWKSDGTLAGTTILKDLNVNGSQGFQNNMVIMNNEVYFAVRKTSGSELWKTNGTTIGTIKVKTTGTIPASYVLNMYSDGNFIFFDWGGLWKSDGTDIGTIKLSETISEVSNFCKVGNSVYFSGFETNYNYELFKTDGTIAGTSLVKDIWPGYSNGSKPTSLINKNGILFFIAITQDPLNYNNVIKNLFKSDGTEAGTEAIKDFTFNITEQYTDYAQFNLIYNQLCFFAADKVYGDEPWKTDGTVSGTTIIKDINPTNLGSGPTEIIVHNNNLYFDANDGINGIEFWKSDGTNSGTTLVKNIRTTLSGGLTGSSSPQNFISLNNLVAFTATNNNATISIFVSDGTSNGTQLLYNSGSSYLQYKMVKMGNNIYFYNNNQLLKSDLQTVSTIANITIESEINIKNDKIYFLARTTTESTRLWVSDGTAAGTFAISPINQYVVSFGHGINNVFFTSTFYDGQTYQNFLYKTDGTIAGTILIKSDIRAELSFSNEYTISNKLFFWKKENINGYNLNKDLYITDGTESGTALIWSGIFDKVFKYQNNLFMSYKDRTTNTIKLYKSDGTNIGSVLFKTFSINSFDDISFKFGSGDYVYFSMYLDYTYSLWRTDGTELGTIKLKDNFDPSTFFEYNGTTYFAGFNGLYNSTEPSIYANSQLFKTNGTIAGTSLVLEDFKGRHGYAAMSQPIFFNGSIYFTTENKINGKEIFKFHSPPPCSPPPNPPTALGTSILPNTSATLTATGCTTYKWYDLATGNNLLYTGQNFTSPILNNNTNYFVACAEANDCESARTEVQVTVNCSSMYTTKSGNINDPTVWSCNRLPNATDIITIETGHIINIPAGTFSVKNIVIKGEINYSGIGILNLNY